jgi:isopenicillin-N epimerase
MASAALRELPYRRQPLFEWLLRYEPPMPSAALQREVLLRTLLETDTIRECHQGGSLIMPLNADAVAHIPLPTGKINLNAGTLSPTPEPVMERAGELRRMMAGNPSDFCWRQIPHLIETSRAALAGYLGCAAGELVLVPNVTYAMNLVVASLELPEGAEVVLTDHEYGSMVKLWERWAAVRGWKLRTVKVPVGRGVTTGELVEVFRGAMTGSTKVLFLYHCASPTGLVLPLGEICAMARERGVITVVDGAHGPGMVPVNLAESGADFYGANLHKWMLGPCGGGFLHVQPERRLEVKPLVTAWGWGYEKEKAFEDSGNGGSRWQWDLEFHGTADRVPQMVVPEMLAFREALGGEGAIAEHYRRLGSYAREVIPLECASAEEPGLCGAVTIFEVPACDGIKVRDELYHEHGVECPVTSTGGRQFLRVSAGVFNNERDVDALAAAVRKVDAFRAGLI